jgi:hypothetical protein
MPYEDLPVVRVVGEVVEQDGEEDRGQGDQEGGQVPGEAAHDEEGEHAAERRLDGEDPAGSHQRVGVAEQGDQRRLLVHGDRREVIVEVAVRDLAGSNSIAEALQPALVGGAEAVSKEGGPVSQPGPEERRRVNRGTVRLESSQSRQREPAHDLGMLDQDRVHSYEFQYGPAKAFGLKPRTLAL